MAQPARHETRNPADEAEDLAYTLAAHRARIEAKDDGRPPCPGPGYRWVDDEKGGYWLSSLDEHERGVERPMAERDVQYEEPIPVYDNRDQVWVQEPRHETVSKPGDRLMDDPFGAYWLSGKERARQRWLEHGEDSLELLRRAESGDGRAYVRLLRDHIPGGRVLARTVGLITATPRLSLAEWRTHPGRLLPALIPRRGPPPRVLAPALLDAVTSLTSAAHAPTRPAPAGALVGAGAWARRPMQ